MLEGGLEEKKDEKDSRQCLGEFRQFQYFLFLLIAMEAQQQRVDKRTAKLSNIRLSLANLPIFNQTTREMQRRVKQNADRQSERTETGIDTGETPSPQKSVSMLLDRFQVGEKIGEGAHGVVRKCFQRGQAGKVFALKSVRLDQEHILFLKRNFTEIKRLHHKNIICYHALFLELHKEQCHLVMDYVPFPDLLHIPIPNEQTLKEIVYQVLQALAYIHSQGVCHRDIKPENILYDAKEKNVKLIDFGVSRQMSTRGRRSDMLTITGTLYYRAPEMFEGGGYDQRVDLWSLGVTIYQLMAGRTPFESAYHHETISNIVKGEFAFTPEVEQRYSKAARNLVCRLLRKRGERLTAREALLDIWLIDLYKGADQLTRALTMNGKTLRIFGHAFKLNHAPLSTLDYNPQPLQRTTTLQAKTHSFQSPDEIMRRLRKQGLIEGESMIYQEEEERRRHSP